MLFPVVRSRRLYFGGTWELGSEAKAKYVSESKLEATQCVAIEAEVNPLRASHVKAKQGGLIEAEIEEARHRARREE